MSDGVLYVEVMPSTKGIGKGITKDIDASLDGSEKKSRNVFGTMAKVGVAAVGAIAVGVAALALKGGISRALNIEDAQAKLKGLGHDTKTIESIMNDALNSVKGTAFGLDTAATVASTAVAAGIKPGKELEKYLRLTADAATIAGSSMEEMGSIINKTTTSGKVMTDDLNQLADRGLPVFQWLQEEYGVTAEELRKMVSAGKVDSETFRKVIEENIGGAALASGDTTRGAFANMMSALSRLGAMFAGPGLGAAKTFFNEVTIVLDGIGERIAPLKDAFAGMLDGLQIEGMGEKILAFFDKLDIGTLLTDAMSGRADMVTVGLGIVQSLLEGLIAAVPQLVQGAADMITRIIEVVVDAAPSLIEGAITLFMGLVDGIIAILPEVIATVIGLIPTIVEALMTMIPALIEGAIALFTALVEAIPVIIPLLVEGIVNLLPVLLEAVVSLIPMLIQGAVDLFMAIVKAIPKIIPPLINGILDLLPVLIDTVIGLIPVLIDAAVDLFTALVEAIPIIIPDLINALIKLGPKIVKTIIGIVPKLFEAGKALIQGLIDGVKDMFGAVGNALGGMMDFIGGFFPHSPAKRGPFSGAGWTQITKSGQAILDEFTSGFDAAMPAVNASLSAMVSPRMVGSSSQPLSGMRLTGKLDLGDGLTGMIDAIVGSSFSSPGQLDSEFA